MPKPRLLIESWLPIEAIGAESKRERGASSALPPLYFLHVWWARRPLIASRAAILAGVLPAWSADWPEPLNIKFPDEKTYHKWFLNVIGILGDPVAARKLIDWETRRGVRSTLDKYGYSRAFTHNPSSDDINVIYQLLNFTWKTKEIGVLDPFSGGGSIPFESLRYGFTTTANDLNPVALIVLLATLDYPARYGPSLTHEVIRWGNVWIEKVKSELDPYFAPPFKQDKRNIYFWARTVSCPTTGKIVPLSPNWWIRKEPNPIAIKVIAENWMTQPQFQILRGTDVKTINPDNGTISGGIGRSPWTGETINGDYIRQEAQAGRMGQILYCVEVNSPSGKEYILPDDDDLKKVRLSEVMLSKKKAYWINSDTLPTESFPKGNDNRPLFYGMPTWADFYSPRQLFSTGTFVEKLREVENEIFEVEKDHLRAKAIIALLSLAVDKAASYNNLQTRWHSGRTVVAQIFDRHDYSFKWSFIEFESPNTLLPWAIEQIADAFEGIAALANPAQKSFLITERLEPIDRLQITRGSANQLPNILDSSIHNITVDPPYYDNVQYAELSDFFYVWLKRTVGHLFPEFFTDELTNKDDEAVANPARFEGMGKSKKDLARQDYERKMLAAFREMHRVLHPDGCLTVMFTHKKVEAWDTLATALINAGFTIQASWPVHTESEHSLHQAKKNAASSTILLACRKRNPSPQPSPEERGGIVWWDDLQGQVRQTARQKAEQFAAQGMHGVDLYLSTFGPTLSIISEHWPVLTSEVDPKTGQPKTLRPETALDLAREEVIRLRKQGLLLGRDIQFDPITDWYLMAWDAFAAEQFPYDEARKLAIALGVDLDHDLMSIARLAVKKGEFVTLQTPLERRKRGMVDEDARSFEHWIDAAHTAMMIYTEDGAGPCEVFLRESGLRRDGTFKALIQALLNAVPRTRIKGKFLRPEAEVLENMRLAFFDDLAAPVEEEVKMPEGVQMGLFSQIEGFAEDEGEEDTQE